MLLSLAVYRMCIFFFPFFFSLAKPWQGSFWRRSWWQPGQERHGTSPVALVCATQPLCSGGPCPLPLCLSPGLWDEGGRLLHARSPELERLPEPEAGCLRRMGPRWGPGPGPQAWVIVHSLAPMTGLEHVTPMAAASCSHPLTAKLVGDGGASASEAAWEGRWCGATHSMNLQCSPQAGARLGGGLGALLGVASEAAFCPKPKLWARSQACEQVAQKKEFKTSSRYFQSPFLCPGDAAVAGGTPASSSPRPSPRPLGPLVGCIIVYFAVETCHV